VSDAAVALLYLRAQARIPGGSVPHNYLPTMQAAYQEELVGLVGNVLLKGGDADDL